MLDFKKAGQHHLWNAKNILIALLLIVLLIELHFHSVNRQSFQSTKTELNNRVLHLQDRVESSVENLKAVVETRNQCLKTLRTTKDEIMALRKSYGDSNDEANKEKEFLKQHINELENKLRQIQTEADKSREQDSNVQELHKQLQWKDDQMKQIKIEKDAEILKLKEKMDALQENAKWKPVQNSASNQIGKEQQLEWKEAVRPLSSVKVVLPITKSPVVLSEFELKEDGQRKPLLEDRQRMQQINHAGNQFGFQKPPSEDHPNLPKVDGGDNTRVKVKQPNEGNLRLSP